MATRYLNDLKIEEGDLQLEVGSNAAPQSYDKIHIGGAGLDSSDAAIYIGNRGDGSGYGYRMYYYGTGSGNNNKLIFKSENLGSPVDMLSFTADGNATFSGTITTGSHGTSANWKQAYDNYITGIGVSGTSTKTITLTQRDGGTITTTFTDLEGSGGGIDMTNGSNNRVVTAVDSDSINAESGLLFGGSYLEITPGNVATPLQIKRTSASTRQVNLLLSANDGSSTSEGFLGVDSSADLRYGASSNTSANSLVLTEDNLILTEGDGIKITNAVPTPTISVNYDTGDSDNLILAASTVTSIAGASSSYGAYMLVAESNPGLAQGPVNKIRVGDIHLDDFGAAEGTINLGSNRIINLAAPQTANDAVNKTYADTKVSKSGDTMTGDLAFSSSGVTGLGKIHYGVNGTMGQTTSWNPNSNNPGLWIESDNTESGGVFMNGNTFALWSPGDDDVFKVYDEDSLPGGTPKFKITGTGLAIGYSGFSCDVNAKNYTWRALNNTANSSNQYYRIARISGSQSSRFIIELAGRSTSYGDTALPAFGKIVGQLNNDNNYDIVYYNASATDEVVDEVGQVDVGTSATDIYVRVGQFSELVATGSISDGTITPYGGDSASQTAPTNYTQVTEYKLWNQGNDGANSGLDADLLDGQHGSHYLNYNNLTNTPAIPIVYNGQLTVQGTGALGGSGTFTANQSGNTVISISHDDTSSQGSVNNSGGTVIQDITLDGYGHVTALGSVNLDGRYYTESESNSRFLRRNANDTWSGDISTTSTNGIRFGSSNQTDTNDGYIAAGRFASGLNIVGTQTTAGTGRQVRVWGDLITNGGHAYWHANNDGAGSGLDADKLDGMQPKSATGAAGSNQILRTHSNGYLYMQNWIDIGDAGIYSTSSSGNGVHFYPNTVSDYGGWRILGTRNGWAGITFLSGENTLMATSSRIGFYNDTDNEWHIDCNRNGSVDLYHDGIKRLYTTTDGVRSPNNITADGNFYGRSVNAAFSAIYRMGGIYFTWDSDSYGTNFNHSITSTDNGSYGDDITINSYGKVRINIDSNNNGTDVFQVGSHTTGTGGNTWFTIKDAGGIMMNDSGNTASGTYALAVNQNTTASSMDAFACGENTTASGRQAFAGGYNTTASGAGSFAIGGNSVASGANSFCAGGDGTATNSAATSIGTLNDATGGHSFAAGYNSTASGLVSFSMGSGATAAGAKATAFGEGNTINGELDFTIGAYNTTSTFSYGNLLMGYDNDITSSTGNKSSLNIIAGTLNHIGTTAISGSDGDLNLVLGSENNVGFFQPSPSTSVLTGAYANRNIVQGEQNNMCGTDSIVVGRYCLSAKGKMQSAIGYGLVTPLGSSTATAPNVNDGNPQFVVGRHNAFDASTGYMHLFAVGNGASDTNRFNSFNVLSSSTGTARVGIAKNVPAYVLDVTGTARFTSGYTTSDERLKENIQDNTLGLAELKQLRTVSYDWKSGEILGQRFEDIDTNKNCRGLIAQEAEIVSPDLVDTDDSEYGIKSIDSGAVTAMLIKAVQEQQDIIESLKERIETLENN